MDIKVDSQTAIVFDLDDTLYNEVNFLKSAYAEISKKLEPDSWQALFSNLFSRYRNKTDVFEYILNRYGVAKNELLDQYRNHIPQIQPFDGVIALFEEIKKREGKIGLITDGRSTTQNNKIVALGLKSYFDHCVISEEQGSEKPNELNYRTIESNLACDTYFYIGDNLKKDFITPNYMGWQTIGLLDNGLNIHSNAYEYQENKFLPHTFISRINEIKIL
jgi:putative hydrolase of the HAD superfamily